jgi:large subunit ribosomal protein L18
MSFYINVCKEGRMSLSREKLIARERRKKRIKKKIQGTLARPRLCIYKSNRYIYAQIIDDLRGITLVSASSLAREKERKNYKSVEVARKVGEELGKLAIKKGIKKIVFDRSGYPYHGRIKALAEGVREQGVEF